MELAILNNQLYEFFQLFIHFPIDFKKVSSFFNSNSNQLETFLQNCYDSLKNPCYTYEQKHKCITFFKYFKAQNQTLDLLFLKNQNLNLISDSFKFNQNNCSISDEIQVESGFKYILKKFMKFNDSNSFYGKIYFIYICQLIKIK